MWDIIAVVIVLIIMLVISAILLSGRGAVFIAGFNMLPKEEQNKMDMVGLCRFMGKIGLGVSCSVALILAYILTEIQILNIIGLLVLALLAILALVWTTIHYRAPLRK